jgi:hypothetical protein
MHREKNQRCIPRKNEHMLDGVQDENDHSGSQDEVHAGKLSDVCSHFSKAEVIPFQIEAPNQCD